MKIERIRKSAFSVIGKEGSTDAGPGFIQALWTEANTHFSEVAHLAKKDETGSFSGFWGAMTDFSRTFQPWEDQFTKGFYLAGVECEDDTIPPEGWTKWSLPGFEFLRAECDRPDLFPVMIAWLEENDISLAGAVQDFTCPKTGKTYMYFPVRILKE